MDLLVWSLSRRLETTTKSKAAGTLYTWWKSKLVNYSLIEKRSSYLKFSSYLLPTFKSTYPHDNDARASPILDTSGHTHIVVLIAHQL